MEFRIDHHPIIPVPSRETVEFTWQGRKLCAYHNDTIAAALFGNGVHIFGYHPKDGAPQGLFCANGQCAQCMVIVDGKPVKSCIELIQPGMRIEPMNGLPVLPEVALHPQVAGITEIPTDVLIIGGGPAGLSAAIELGKHGIRTCLIDDKHKLGGKLVLQTHRFFGSTQAVYAGTRGIDIAARLENELSLFPSVSIWLNSTALAVFSDQKVGVLRHGREYVLVSPRVVLTACGAREKFLVFPGNTLPGVLGAGAFQTLVNRDLVRPSSRLFIVGGGNVGLIAGYHALQAGIQVVGLIEVLPECGGYKVHRDKLARMGVPIYTSHTIISANGEKSVESISIAQVDPLFTPIPGTERSYDCDCILIAVGLDPIDEFYTKAKDFGLPAFAAGDAEEIAEASAAIYSGKIKGLEIARHLGVTQDSIPKEWYALGDILKSKPGKIVQNRPNEFSAGFVPIIHCTQEIPCDPCSENCPQGLILIDPHDIRELPTYAGNMFSCRGCEQCVVSCPGLAITLVDYRKDPAFPIVSIPFEFDETAVQVHDRVQVLDTEGVSLGEVEVVKIIKLRKNDRTRIVKVRAPADIAVIIAGIRVQETGVADPLDHYVAHIADDTIVCRCERVTAGEVRKIIREGIRDMNEIKTLTRAGMGSCGAKTCGHLTQRLFKEAGIPSEQVTELTNRPLFIEVPLEVFAGCSAGDEADHVP